MTWTAVPAAEAIDSDGSLAYDASALSAQVGDYLQLIYQRDNNGGTITPPTGGWTTLLAPVGGNSQVAMYGLLLTGAPASSYSVGNTDLTGNAHGMLLRKNMSGKTFVSNTLVTRANNTGTSAVSNTATNAGDQSDLVMVWDSDDNTTISGHPADMDIMGGGVINGDSSELAVYTQLLFSTGTKTLTWGSSVDWSCFGSVFRYTLNPTANADSRSMPRGVRRGFSRGMAMVRAASGLLVPRHSTPAGLVLAGA